MSEMEEMDEQADVVLRKIGNFGVAAKMSKVVNENASYCPNDIPPASEYLSGTGVSSLSIVFSDFRGYLAKILWTCVQIVFEINDCNNLFIFISHARFYTLFSIKKT